jgi:flagellar protein FlbD
LRQFTRLIHPSARRFPVTQSVIEPISKLKASMIRLTRINKVPLVLNSDLIEHVEATPDTVIALTTGQKLVVLESADEVVEKVIEFRRAIADHSETSAALKRRQETTA